MGPAGGMPAGSGLTTAAGAGPATAGAGNAAVTLPTSLAQAPVGSIGPSSIVVTNGVLVPPQTPAGHGAANGMPHGPATPVTPPQASPPQAPPTTTSTTPLVGVFQVKHSWGGDDASPGRGGGAVGGGRGRGRGTLWN